MNKANNVLKHISRDGLVFPSVQTASFNSISNSTSSLMGEVFFYALFLMTGMSATNPP